MPGEQNPDAQASAAVVPEQDALTQQVQMVARARAVRDALKLQRDRSYQAWLTQHTELNAAVEQSAQNVVQLEDALRAMGRKRYEATREKQLLPGVSVREEIELTFDGAAAFEWAKANSLCLMLDVKAFEAVAKSNKLPFVDRKPVPRITLAKDLTSYLKPEPEPAT